MFYYFDYYMEKKFNWFVWILIIVLCLLIILLIIYNFFIVEFKGKIFNGLIILLILFIVLIFSEVFDNIFLGIIFSLNRKIFEKKEEVKELKLEK